MIEFLPPIEYKLTQDPKDDRDTETFWAPFELVVQGSCLTGQISCDAHALLSIWGDASLYLDSLFSVMILKMIQEMQSEHKFPLSGPLKLSFPNENLHAAIEGTKTRLRVP